VGLERGPLSLVRAIQELLERKSSGSSLENRDYCHRGFAALTIFIYVHAISTSTFYDDLCMTNYILGSLYL
jgi:hypothetical protein